MNKEDVVDLAKSYAAKGFLCSESVLLSVSDGLEIRNDVIPKIATGFGAGIGGQGMVCGAISGAIMGLGLKFGRNEVEKKDDKPYWFAFEFLKRFRKEWGYVTCRELTGCDFSTEAGQKEYDDEKMWETKCREYIAAASGMAFDLIYEKHVYDSE
ncbi:C_GCAxxG_C_C family protein [Candidatus Bathyarchaeota archaeon]|nr:C_GCAxxG_C_C family protein [Candidatus Bathyarchaeota archaeon]